MPIKSTEYIYEQSYLTLPRNIYANLDLSVHARMLYMYLLDISKLSEQNGYMDDKGIFVYCSIETAANIIGCRLNKAHDTFDELIEKGLLEKRRLGLGKPNKYYVNAVQNVAEEASETTENHVQQPEAPSVSVQNVTVPTTEPHFDPYQNYSTMLPQTKSDPWTPEADTEMKRMLALQMLENC